MAMGDIYVLDKNFNLVYVIDTYKSCIWSNRYVELGDCELYLPATPQLLTVLVKDYYLIRQNDDMVCRIKKIQLDTDAENGDYIIVTGKDTKDLCDQRIVWSTMTCDGAVETFIRQMVTKTMITPDLSARTMLKANGSALVALGTAAGFTDVMTEQVSYKNVGEKIREYCTKYGWGYKMILIGSILNFILYKGMDRSDSVFFSDDYENLDTTTYTEDATHLGNVALVGGEGEGSERSRNVSGYEEGTDRYEIFVDAKDITQTVSWSDLVSLYPTTDSGGQGYFATEGSQNVYKLNYLNVHIVDSDQLTQLKANYPSGQEIMIDGIDYYQVYNVTIANVPSQSPSDNDNVTLRAILYEVYLLNRGYEKLAEYGEKITFNGTIEPAVTFEYKQDYNLGDIVTVQNRYGISASVRIVEVIEVDDDNGYSVQPKFEYIDIDFDPNAYILTHDDNVLLSENDEAMIIENSVWNPSAAAQATNGVKISQLDEATTIDDSYYLPIASNTNTLKVSYSNLVDQVAQDVEATTDYEDLINKPKINNIELIQDKSFDDLGLQGLTNAEIENLLDS